LGEVERGGSEVEAERDGSKVEAERDGSKVEAGRKNPVKSRWCGAFFTNFASPNR
jgi:hypothetical protein